MILLTLGQGTVRRVKTLARHEAHGPASRDHVVRIRSAFPNQPHGRHDPTDIDWGESRLRSALCRAAKDRSRPHLIVLFSLWSVGRVPPSRRDAVQPYGSAGHVEMEWAFEVGG